MDSLAIIIGVTAIILAIASTVISIRTTRKASNEAGLEKQDALDILRAVFERIRRNLHI
jgi:flagellar basal body-associated protein FliL